MNSHTMNGERRQASSRVRAWSLAASASLLLAACDDARAPDPDVGGASGRAGAPTSAAAAPRPGASAGSARSAAGATLATATFRVDGMNCGSCVLATRAALQRLPGVQRAEARYNDRAEGGRASAVYDPAKVSPAQMIAAIRALGYVPTLITE